MAVTSNDARAGLLHVGLNLLFLVPGETGGMEVAARELVASLGTVAPELRITAFVNRETAEAGGGPWGDIIPAVTVPVRARNRIEWVRGEQTLLPRMAGARDVDLVHSLASTAPVWGRFRRVVTVHDLIYARFPETHTGVRGLGMRFLVPVGARRSHRIIADSESTRRDLVELARARPERIDVVPLGLGTVRSVGALDEGATRARFELGSRTVLLSLSAKRPHKNLLRLISALALISAESRPLLVLPGYPTEHEAELKAHAAHLGLGGDVRFPGWVSGEEVEGLWALTGAFIFPSLYEGFGLPLLEAMERGVPVACSNASSLPEVAGDAALQFDPHDERAMAAAIERLLGDPTEAQRLRVRGHERARQFTWERTARGTVDTYERAMTGPGPR